MLKNLNFDLFLSGLKSQTKKKILQEIAEAASPMCGVSGEALESVLLTDDDSRPCAIGQGVAVIEAKSPEILKPVLVISVLDHKVDFSAPDDVPVDIVAAVISPENDGSYHLQRVAGASMLLRDQDLCNALRTTKDEESMRALLLPVQKIQASAA